jgi:hypothetical protein
LAAVVVDHRLLHRVQGAVGPAMPSTVRTALPSSCGRNRMQAFSARAPSVGDHHGAGAAIALVAAFLGAGQPARLAQPVEQGDGRRRRHILRLAVQKKPDRSSFNARRNTCRGGRPAFDAA